MEVLHTIHFAGLVLQRSWMGGSGRWTGARLARWKDEWVDGRLGG